MAEFINREQLVSMAGDLLLLSDSANEMADQDEDKIDAEVDGLLSEQAELGNVYIANEDEIPVAYARSLALLLANQVSPTFGRPGMPEADKRTIEQRLRTMTAARPTYQVLRVTYF